MKDYVVLVGTHEDSEHPEYKELGGIDVWGPYTYDEAVEFERKVREVWEQHKPGEFVFGTPFAELKRLSVSAHPIYEPVAVAAANWYLDPNITTL
jgi:hypothetical protein